MVDWWSLASLSETGVRSSAPEWSLIVPCGSHVLCELWLEALDKAESLRRNREAGLIWSASLCQPEAIDLGLLLFPIILHDRLEFLPPESLFAAAA